MTFIKIQNIKFITYKICPDLKKLQWNDCTILQACSRKLK